MHPYQAHPLANEKIRDLRRAAERNQLLSSARPTPTTYHGAWTPCCADTGPPPTSSTSPARQPTGREEPSR